MEKTLIVICIPSCYLHWQWDRKRNTKQPAGDMDLSPRELPSAAAQLQVFSTLAVGEKLICIKASVWAPKLAI